MLSTVDSRISSESALLIWDIDIANNLKRSLHFTSSKTISLSLISLVGMCINHWEKIEIEISFSERMDADYESMSHYADIKKYDEAGVIVREEQLEEEEDRGGGGGGGGGGGKRTMTKQGLIIMKFKYYNRVTEKSKLEESNSQNKLDINQSRNPDLNSVYPLEQILKDSEGGYRYWEEKNRKNHEMVNNEDIDKNEFQDDFLDFYNRCEEFLSPRSSTSFSPTSYDEKCVCWLPCGIVENVCTAPCAHDYEKMGRIKRFDDENYVEVPLSVKESTISICTEKEKSEEMKLQRGAEQKGLINMIKQNLPAEKRRQDLKFGEKRTESRERGGRGILKEGNDEKFLGKVDANQSTDIDGNNDKKEEKEEEDREGYDGFDCQNEIKDQNEERVFESEVNSNQSLPLSLPLNQSLPSALPLHLSLHHGEEEVVETDVHRRSPSCITMEQTSKSNKRGGDEGGGERGGVEEEEEEEEEKYECLSVRASVRSLSESTTGTLTSFDQSYLQIPLSDIRSESSDNSSTSSHESMKTPPSSSGKFKGGLRDKNIAISAEEMERKKRRAAHTALSSAALLSSMVENDLRQYNLDTPSCDNQDRSRLRHGSVPSFLTRMSRALSNSSIGHTSVSSTLSTIHSANLLQNQLPALSTSVLSSITTSPQSSSSPSKLRVLLVEDSPVVQKVRTSLNSQ